MLLTKSFTADQYAIGLESWSWLDVAGKTPALSSLFGHVFLGAADGYWLLETIEGTLTHRWPTGQALNAQLDTEDGQDDLLLGGLAMAAHARGLALADDEVYDFERPPILGGGFGVENITKRDFVISLNLAGQLHRQLRSLPPGTGASGFAADQ